MEREALSLAMDGLERILGSFEKEGKFVRSSMIRNELFDEIHLLLVQAKKALAHPAQEPVGVLHIERLDKWLDASLKERKQREWVGLTDEEKADLVHELFAPCSKEASAALYLLTAHYNKLKEKNT